MNEREKEEIIRRLGRRFGASPAPLYPERFGDGAGLTEESPQSLVVEDSLHQLVKIGASRFGIGADAREVSRFSACDLAPPLARLIDHTALKPETTLSDVQSVCDEARQFCFASVCVNPSFIPFVAEWLAGSPVAVCTVVGFPLGANRTQVKEREAAMAVADGATEVDMVLNVGMLKSEQFDYVESDIRAVVRASRRGSGRVVTKVILETALLSDEEKVIACVLAQNAGADFVKTSTGFSKGGATAADVALMRRAVGAGMGVKASGGIRSAEDAETMIAHGATRIGASASVAIVKGLKAETSY